MLAKALQGEENVHTFSLASIFKTFRLSAVAMNTHAEERFKGQAGVSCDLDHTDNSLITSLIN